MGIWAILQKTEQNLRKRIETALGSEVAVQQFIETRREILEKLESAMATDASGRFFPYVRVLVTLHPPSKELQDGFRTAFLHEDSLKTDIRQMLDEPGVRHPENLEISVVLQGNENADPFGVSSGAAFAIRFEKPGLDVRKEIPGVRLRVVRGKTEQPEYHLQKERILIGRTADVSDREGRIIRKNDVVFLDDDEDVNITVGYVHARIWWDAERKEFLLMDEASRYGTCIVRDGRSIEVPSGDPLGVGLRARDEVYCGQACLRFEIAPV